MIKVLIADDHHLVRNGLAALLQKLDDIVVVGEASDGVEAVDKCAELRPDVVVMDIAMPRLDGSQAARKIISSGDPPAVVMLSIHTDPVLIQQLVRTGVKGYLLKKSAPEELALAVRSASQRKLYLSPLIADSVLDGLINRPSGESPRKRADLLTAREREVLQLIAEGNTNHAIANTLKISVKTVEKHRANLMAKLEVQGMAELIRVAFLQGLIFSDLFEQTDAASWAAGQAPDG
ncbi:MAG TPA: response regulator transcription factor [Anaerolineales bacterium]|nr:response regulator transcription factor [Anaerolineales bacterium]